MNLGVDKSFVQTVFERYLLVADGKFHLLAGNFFINTSIETFINIVKENKKFFTGEVMDFGFTDKYEQEEYLKLRCKRFSLVRLSLIDLGYIESKNTIDNKVLFTQYSMNDIDKILEDIEIRKVRLMKIKEAEELRYKERKLAVLNIDLNQKVCLTIKELNNMLDVNITKHIDFIKEHII